MKLSPDLKEFIELLNSHKVEFLIVGAHALAFHGLPRYTRDVDFFIASTPENAAALANVIDAFGFASTRLKAADFLVPDSVIQLGVEPHRIDLLTGLSGIDWSEAWETKQSGTIGGLPVFFLSRENYIKNKLASGRPQDLADVARLRAMDSH
ncbi:nucleotidyltransferase [Haloferula sargassicola]|uniref:Nucleotidyltransferase family protein n=1 Tax=Haloferula sargassicola TaxID=490096 RepID=A0ABP9UMJ8_9BACT